MMIRIAIFFSQELVLSDWFSDCLLILTVSVYNVLDEGGLKSLGGIFMR